jgi:DNA-3-methyladenine glycosylase I
MKKRCRWANPKNPTYIRYHDEEWGRARRHSDQYLFEMICLEGAQAGLSWETVLNKREEYRKVFHGFDVKQCARMQTRQLERLMRNPGIIRNRLKILSVRENARAFLAVAEEFGSFARYLREFDGVDALEQSKALSRDLKKRGFGFVGATICYAFMQAIGMVNDHERGCFLAKRQKGVRHLFANSLKN